MIFEQVRDLVWECAGKRLASKEDITSESHIMFDLGLDSLDRLELCLLCEEHFVLSIPDTDAEKLSTVGDIVRYVENRRRIISEGA